MSTTLITSFDEIPLREWYHILHARIAVFVIEQSCPYQECDGKDFDSFHLRIYQNLDLVAYCRILPPDISYTGYASIGRVLTTETGRNQGFGKKLMQEALQFSDSRFQASIKISAQAYLEKFYTELGFETSSAPYLEDDIPHIAMVRKFPATV